MTRSALHATLLAAILFAGSAPAAGFGNDDIATLLGRVSSEVVGADGRWRLVVGGRAVTVSTDPVHDRVRIMGHVTAAEALDEERLTRLMQANFDTALDARYALARNTLWSVYVHPLGSLSAHDFLAALGQVVNLAATFGGAYHSGLLAPAGADGAAAAGRALIDELLARGLAQ